MIIEVNGTVLNTEHITYITAVNKCVRRICIYPHRVEPAHAYAYFTIHFLSKDDTINVTVASDVLPLGWDDEELIETNANLLETMATKMRAEIVHFWTNRMDGRGHRNVPTLNFIKPENTNL